MKFASDNLETLGKMLGTADLLGQMADRLYLEKLIPLFREYEEGKVHGFASELDLFQKTSNFYCVTKVRFEKDLGNVNRYMLSHFKKRWHIERNIYNESKNKYSILSHSCPLKLLQIFVNTSIDSFGKST